MSSSYQFYYQTHKYAKAQLVLLLLYRVLVFTSLFMNNIFYSSSARLLNKLKTWSNFLSSQTRVVYEWLGSSTTLTVVPKKRKSILFWSLPSTHYWKPPTWQTECIGDMLNVDVTNKIILKIPHWPPRQHKMPPQKIKKQLMK